MLFLTNVHSISFNPEKGSFFALCHGTGGAVKGWATISLFFVVVVVSF